jgi:hypothetical protein
VVRRFKSGVLSRVDWQIVTDVSKVHSIFVFRVEQFFYGCLT